MSKGKIMSVSFEYSFDELENNELSLDESVDKFQKGMELSKYCNSLLEAAEKKISVLIDNGEGTMIEKNFDIENEGE